MSEMKSVLGVLEIIKSITSNHESGRLEIVASGTRGTLLFKEGKLVDARLGTLAGFPAVNAAVALRDVQVSFDHVTPAPHSSSITPSERLVLHRFFGIEAADTNEPAGTAEPEIDWNPAPEPVVPLEEASTIPLALSSVPRLAVCLVLLIGLAVGAIALRSRFRAPQTSAPPAAAVQSQASAPNVQDLTGEWQVVNTVQKTAYKSFDNMSVGFHLTIDQQGKQFTGKGEKFSENGQTLPVVNRTPIHVTGSIDGDNVVATFVEDGTTRRTNGRFVWKLQNGGDELAGTFVSTAANSSGRSALTKQQ